MKTKLLILSILLFYFLNEGKGQERDESKIVTAGEYCEFLNAGAPSYPYNLYDATSKQIIRLGDPRNYDYEVAVQQVNAPMQFMSRNDAEHYCNWKNNGDSTLNFICCEANAANIDCSLKSNLFTFRLVSAAAHQASLTGEAAAGEMSEVFEAIGAAILFTAGGGAEIDHSRGQASPNTSHAIVEENSNTTSSTSIFLSRKSLPSTLSSKEEAAEAIRRIVLNQSFDLNFHYKETDKHWESAAEAWNERAQANKKIRITNEQKEHAQQELEQAKKRTTSEECQKAILGRIAQYSSDAATRGIIAAGVVAAAAPFTGPGAPFVLAASGGIAAAAGTSETVSKIAEKANHIWATRKKLIAQRAAQRATQEHNAAIEYLAAIKVKVQKLEQAAQEAERNAWLEASRAKRSATALLHPPRISLHEAAWEEWGERILQEGKGEHSWKDALISEGKNDPFWAAQTVEMALRERMVRELKRHEEEKNTAIEQQEQLLSQVDNEIERKKKKMEEAWKTVKELSQSHENLKKELENINNQLDEFERRHEDTKYQRGMHDAWEATKKALCDTFEKAATTANELHEKEKELRKREEKFHKAEIKASFIDSNYTETKKTFARKEARLLGKEESVTEWQLPRFLREETTEELTSNQTSIEAPERLDSAWETLGRRIKEQEAREEQTAQIARASASSLENQQQMDLSIETSQETISASLQEAILLFLENDYKKSPRIHQDRLEARHELEKRIKEKDLVTTQRSLPREPFRATFLGAPSQNSYRRNFFDLMNIRPRRTSMSEPSETGSVSDISSQTDSTIDSEAYQKITVAARAVDTAQAKLDVLIWDAEKLRSGEDASFPTQVLAGEWNKADTEFQKYLKEQEERLKEIAFRAKEEKNWEENLKRWECINEIEWKKEELKTARKKVRDLIKLKDPNWQQADHEAQACEKELKERQEKWDALANQEENICLLKNNGADETTLQRARDELQEADYQINELGKKIKAQYQDKSLGDELQDFLNSLLLSEKEKSIAGIWVVQLNREERVAEERRDFAAECYFDGDLEPWGKLTAKERSKYNNLNRKANINRQEEEGKKLREAQEEAKKTKIRSDRYNSDTMASYIQRSRYPTIKAAQILKDAEQAANALKELQEKKAEREKFIHLAKLSPEAQKEKIKEKTYPQKEADLKANATNLVVKARQAERIASDVRHKAAAAKGEEALLLCEEAIKAAEEDKLAWAHASEAYKKGLEATPKNREDLKNWWTQEIENIENQKMACEAFAVLRKTEKTERIANDVRGKANSTKGEEALLLWEEAIKQAEEVELAWAHAAEIYKQGLEAVPKHREDLKNWWRKEIETTEDNKMRWEAITAFRKAQKASAIANDVRGKANSTKGEEAILLWEEAIKAEEEVELVLTHAVEVYKQGLKAIPAHREDLKAWWTNEIENTENQKMVWEAVTASRKAKKTERLANDVGDKAGEAKGEEAILLWEEAIKAAEEVELAWAHAAEISKKGLTAVPAHREDLKNWWSKEIESAEDNKMTWGAIAALRKAKKAESIANDVGDKAGEAKGEEAILLWEEAIKAAEEVELAYVHVAEAYKQGLTAIPAHREDLKNWLAKEIKNIEDNKMAWKAALTLGQARKAESIANDVSDKAGEAKREEATSLWEEAIKKAEEVEFAWAHAAEVYKQDLEAVPAHREDLKNWLAKEIKNIEDNKMAWKVALTLGQARKAESIANDVSDKAGEAKGEEATSLWEEAIKKAEEVEFAWAHAAEIYKQGLEAVPKHREDLKNWWSKEIENTEENKMKWEAFAALRKAQKAESIANDARDKAAAAKGEEAILLWDQAIQQTKRAEAVFTQVLEIYKTGRYQALEQFKDWWSERFIAIEKAKNALTVKIAELAAKRAQLKHEQEEIQKLEAQHSAE